MAPKKEFVYTIERHIATIGSIGDLSTELNVVRYCDGEAKYDLRRWRVINGEKRLQKGLTMTRDELYLLKDALNSMDELA